MSTCSFCSWKKGERLLGEITGMIQTVRSCYPSTEGLKGGGQEQSGQPLKAPEWKRWIQPQHLRVHCLILRPAPGLEREAVPQAFTNHLPSGAGAWAVSAE